MRNWTKMSLTYRCVCACVNVHAKRKRKKKYFKFRFWKELRCAYEFSFQQKLNAHTLTLTKGLHSTATTRTIKFIKQEKSIFCCWLFFCHNVQMFVIFWAIHTTWDDFANIQCAHFAWVLVRSLFSSIFSEGEQRNINGPKNGGIKRSQTQNMLAQKKRKSRYIRNIVAFHSIQYFSVALQPLFLTCHYICNL